MAVDPLLGKLRNKIRHVDAEIISAIRLQVTFWNLLHAQFINRPVAELSGPWSNGYFAILLAKRGCSNRMQLPRYVIVIKVPLGLVDNMNIIFNQLICW